jgi:hypothetical protein
MLISQPTQEMHMITPAQFLAAQSARVADLNPTHLAQIRKDIDTAIAGTGAGSTVRVRKTRSNWSTVEVQAVLDEYAAAGWIVDTSDSSCLALLTAPNPQADVQAALDAAGPDEVVIGGRGNGPVIMPIAPPFKP